MATYEIFTLDDLQDIASGHMADDCVLMNNIDALHPDDILDPSGVPVDEWNPKDIVNFPGVYYGFEPLYHAASGTLFTGTFDGGGFTISNLYINRPSAFYGTETFISIFERFSYRRNLYIDKIEPFVGKPVVKVITGMRRVGKSCF